MKPLKVAIIQKKPAYGDITKSTQIAQSLINEAALNKSNLIVFGETWLSGYPAWLDHCPEIAFWNNEATKDAFMQMYKNSAAVDGAEMKAICAAAKKNKVIVCLGFNEKILKGNGNGTLYNSFVFINEKGELINHHRKLVPTFTEKLLYGNGDAAGLKTCDTKWGKIAGLICWEHWMPFSRQVLHNEGEIIHIALWPTVHEMHQVASRHYAFEGRCFVIAAGQMMQVKDFPSNLILPKHLKEDTEKYILNGGSCVFDAKGNYLMMPQFDKEEILYCTIENTDTAIKEKMTLDTSGHYYRPDIFEFNVNRKKR